MALTTQDLVELLKKHPISISCGLLSALLAVGVYYRGSSVGELQTKLQKTEEEGQKIRANVRNGANLPEQLTAIEKAVKEIDSRLVRCSDLGTNLQYFFRIGSESAVQVVDLRQTTMSLSSAQAKAKTNYYGISFAITIQDEYRKVLNFLGRLESGPRFFRLSSAGASRMGQRGEGGTSAEAMVSLTVNLELLGLP
jgi:hypothetical protein